MAGKTRSFRIGRSAITGRVMSVRAARRRRSTAVVEGIRRRGKK